MAPPTSAGPAGSCRPACALAIVVLLAGCLQDLAPPGPAAGFTATLRDASGQQVMVRLHGPVPIRDATGLMVQAYALDLSAPTDPGEVLFTHYLDGQFRLIRSDGHCVPGDCDHYQTVSFLGRGAPAPFGIGLDLMASRDNVSGFASRAWKAYPHDARPAHGPTVDILEGDVHLPAGSYRFTQGRRLPDGPQHEVIQYEPGNPLPAIPAIGPPRLQPPDGLVLFRGADEDAFGVGKSPAQFL